MVELCGILVWYKKMLERFPVLWTKYVIYNINYGIDMALSR